jgi:hypothetical protein
MITALNKHLINSELSLRSCAAFSIEELNQLVRSIYPAFHPVLQQIYAANGDSRSLRYSSLDDYERTWDYESRYMSHSPESQELLRDAKCHEVVMLFVHHLTASSREELGHLLQLPTLPLIDHTSEDHQQGPEAKSRYAFEAYLNAIPPAAVVTQARVSAQLLDSMKMRRSFLPYFKQQCMLALSEPTMGPVGAQQGLDHSIAVVHTESSIMITQRDAAGWTLTIRAVINGLAAQHQGSHTYLHVRDTRDLARS